MTELGLTRDERRSLRCDCVRLDNVWHHDAFCPVPAVERILSGRQSNATAPLAADQPPVCPDHREAQHRDNKPPWCDSCGWRHGEPARRYGNGRVMA